MPLDTLQNTTMDLYGQAGLLDSHVELLLLPR